MTARISPTWSSVRHSSTRTERSRLRSCPIICTSPPRATASGPMPWSQPSGGCSMNPEGKTEQLGVWAPVQGSKDGRGGHIELSQQVGQDGQGGPVRHHLPCHLSAEGCPAHEERTPGPRTGVGSDRVFWLTKNSV